MSIHRLVGRDLIRFLASAEGAMALALLPEQLRVRAIAAAEADAARTLEQKKVRAARAAEQREEDRLWRELEREQEEEMKEDERLLALDPLKMTPVIEIAIDPLRAPMEYLIRNRVTLVTIEMALPRHFKVSGGQPINYADLIRYADRDGSMVKIVGSRRPVTRRVCLMQFAPGRSVEWVERYCKNKPFLPATIWDGLELPPEELRGREIIMAGSAWFPSVQMGGETNSYPVIFEDEHGSTLLGEINPYYPLKSSPDLWWLMLMK